VAQILVFDVKIPLTKGDTVSLFFLFSASSSFTTTFLFSGGAALPQHE